MDIATEYIFMAWILNWVSNSFVQDCRYHCGHCLVASEFYSGKLIFVSNLPEGKWSLHLAKSSSETSSHPLCVHAIPDSPPGKYVCHRVSSLASRVNGYANCMVNKKVNKNALYKWKHAYLHRKLHFISSSPFSTLPNLLQYFWLIYPEQVIAQLSRVIYGRNQQVESE
jgi:hypothetical protein